ncbi:MAG: histone deacetylase [Rhizobacter sp.]|nr:histone deacetylase [Rhizobacter sp.]
MQVFHADRVQVTLPAGHRFPMEKYGLLYARLINELPLLRIHEAVPATDGELALAHTPTYIDSVERGLLSAAEQREIGFPWSPAMAARARRSVGATIDAARAALVEGLAANMAGGTHHAYADKGSGYCVFNDVAVAARLMQAEWHRTGQVRGLLRIAVIDLDVHQGNGTASIFKDDASVFTLSMHGARNFPFRKEASDLDIELPDGCADDAYLAALDGALEQLWAHHERALPGLIFYLAGADPHEGDRLGRLKVSTQGLAERDRRVLDAARQRGIPVAMSMAGGYGRVIEDTVAVQLGTMRAALQSWQRWKNGDHGQAHRYP